MYMVTVFVIRLLIDKNLMRYSLYLLYVRYSLSETPKVSGWIKHSKRKFLKKSAPQLTADFTLMIQFSLIFCVYEFG